LCVEAEALGCNVDFQTDVDVLLAPVVITPLPLDPAIDFKIDLEKAGRIPLVAQAIRLLKSDVGRAVAIGAWIPGPFTLAWQVFGMDGWLTVVSDENRAASWLASFADFLARVGNFYRTAGADFLTVHEMGGTAQVVGASRFRKLIQPALVRLFSQLPSPKILSICGDTNTIVREMALCGASALHFDQKNDVEHTRQMLGRDAIVLGNLDPLNVLSYGTPALIREKVSEAANAGVNAVMPGCDVYPDVSTTNMRAWVDQVNKHE
jgi:[methyl-Co(III) methanol-specific corrinoid protein]:coenzyme M methyltransferase